MARNIKINCRKVYHTGSSYQQSAVQIQNIQAKMREISSNISSIWQGNDSNQFLLKFNNHIEYLNNLVDFLNDKGDVLKQNALNHNRADREFLNRMKRTDFDE